MKPVLQALVLAERIYEDKYTGQKIIAGTFNTVLMIEAPTGEDFAQPDGRKGKIVAGGLRRGDPYAYVSLTDVWDGTVLDLQFVSLDRNKVLFETQITIEKANRLETIELSIPLPPLHVSKPGTYAFEIVCEGEILGSHRIVAQRATAQNEESGIRDEGDQQ